MKTEEVQLRVLQGGQPLSLDKFTWCEDTNTFSSKENNLVLDFSGVRNCTFKTGIGCTFETDSSCTFKTGSYCTFDTGSSCTFDTGSSCMFKTGSSCTFNTDDYCTFDTGSSCTFDTGNYCVIVRRDIFEVIQPKGKIKLCPYDIKGYLEFNEDDGKYYKDGVWSDIFDGVLSTIISKKGNVYKVINHGENNESYVVTDGENYSHGKTIKQAKEDLIYKISNRDLSEYDGLTLESVVSFEDAVKMYRKITGSCESQTKEFAEKHKKYSYTIKELIKITEGQYNSNLLKQYYENT